LTATELRRLKITAGAPRRHDGRGVWAARCARPNATSPGRPQAPDVCTSLRQLLALTHAIPHEGHHQQAALDFHASTMAHLGSGGVLRHLSRRLAATRGARSEECRVWCHPERSAPCERDGNDYFHAFASYDDAAAFARATPGAEEPLALVLQKEYIEEPEPGHYRHVREHRLTEWPVSFLQRSRCTPSTIPDFLAPDAPPNRLDILRGLT